MAGGSLALLGARGLNRRLVVSAVLAVALLIAVRSLPHRILLYLKRGETVEQTLHMSDRTVIWAKGLDLASESAVLGFGFHADRIYLGGKHVHNSYIQALLQAGLVGTALFVSAWLLAWLEFVRARLRWRRLSSDDQRCLVEAGGVLVFLTARSIPECTGSFFSVDLVILLPILAYIQSLQPLVRRPVAPTSRFALTPPISPSHQLLDGATDQQRGESRLR